MSSLKVSHLTLVQNQLPTANCAFCIARPSFLPAPYLLEVTFMENRIIYWFSGNIIFLWHATSEKEVILDMITAFKPHLLLSPLPFFLYLYVPAVLLDDSTSSICFCPSLSSSSWQYKLLQQLHNFICNHFAPLAYGSAQTLFFFLDQAGYWCADLRVTSELRGL